MPPSHTLSTRRPTADERRLIEAAARVDLPAYGCLFLFFGIWPVAIVLVIIASLVGLMPSPPVYGWLLLAVMLVTSGGTFGWVLAKFRASDLRLRRLAAEDAAEMLVQVLEVHHPLVVEIRPVDENEPVLAMDIGRGVMLLLQGQWLREEPTYGAPELAGDPVESVLNGLPSPHSFPSDAFTLTRLSQSGRVLGVEVSGAYVAPGEALVDGPSGGWDFGDSALAEGDLDDVAGVIGRVG